MKMSPFQNQILVVVGAISNIVAVGFHLGYPTLLLRDLRAKESDIKLNLEAESWIASAIAITTLPSFLLAGPILQKLGRKWTHFYVVTPSLLSCLLLYFAQNPTTLFISRLVSGFNTGASLVVAAIIIGEYSNPKYRGVYLNAKTAGATLGVLYVHTLGIYFDWRTTALFGLIPPILSFLITTMWPESPAWLAYMGKYEACEESFLRLRGNSAEASEELLLLIQTQKERRLQEIRNSSQMNILKQFLVRLTKKDFLKPSLIVFFIFVIMEACGRHSFPSYAVNFMSAFTKDSSTTLYYVLVVDSVIFLGSLCSCGVVKLFPRRTLLFTSGAVSCILLIAICVYLYLKSQHFVPEDNIWLPLTLLCLYFIVLNLGTSPIALSLLGEIYPLEHRAVGTVVSGSMFSLSLLVTLKVTPALIRAIDVHGTFSVFVTCMAGSLVYLYFILPETEGKTLQEIESIFYKTPLKLDTESEEKLLKRKKHDQTDLLV